MRIPDGRFDEVGRVGESDPEYLGSDLALGAGHRDPAL
jgi:hypothetical protein